MGAEWEDVGCMLSVGTGPECPEDNLRELTWHRNPNCGIARGKTRERENFPATAWLDHRTKDWVNTRGELAGCGRAGRQQPELEGEGQSQLQRWHPLTNCEQAPSYQRSLPAILDGWHLPGGSQSEISSPEETHGTPEMVLPLHTRETEGLGRGGDKTHHPPKERAITKHLVTWAARTWEKHKMQAQLSLCLCGIPENLNRSGLDLGSARNPGPALERAPAEQPGAWAVWTGKAHML